MLAINNLSVEFAAKPLFKDISFSINDNDRLALVGKNGAGKSTLLKIIAGQQLPSSGSVALPNDLSVGYLPQEMTVEDDSTLFDEAKKAFKERSEMDLKLRQLRSMIAERQDHESPEFMLLLSKADDLSNQIHIKYPENIDAEIEKILIGLGFKNSDFSRFTKEFSGGWRMRIELAKILLRKPDLLLLDEPTNHLDINSIQWLEQFLINKSGAVVLVSHDRTFLDNVTKRTIEISCGKIYDYKVSYTPFQQLRKERIETQLKAYENQQKFIAETKDFIERFRYKATKAVQVQSRIKQLEKIVPIEIDAEDTSSVKFKFPTAERSGDFPLVTEDLSKNYGPLQVFSGIDFSMRRGEKVALVGSNGEGKSTFIKCIMGEIPYDGSLKIGHNVKIGYFAQNQAQTLDPSKTVFETVDDVATGEIRTRLKDLLAAFLFRGEDIDKKVAVLSGGEKTRLAMAKLLLEPTNFLILDEPTNHLDMRTKDVLKLALQEFKGTLVIVSHDRNFLDGLVDKIYEFAGGKVKEHIGGIFDYLRKKKSQFPDLKSGILPDSSLDVKKDSCSSNALSYQQKKEFDRNIRKAEKKVAVIEKKIEELETQISLLEDKMAHGVIDDSIMKEYSSLKTAIDSLTSDWETAQTQLDLLKSSFA